MNRPSLSPHVACNCSSVLPIWIEATVFRQTLCACFLVFPSGLNLCWKLGISPLLYHFLMHWKDFSHLCTPIRPQCSLVLNSASEIDHPASAKTTGVSNRAQLWLYVSVLICKYGVCMCPCGYAVVDVYLPWLCKYSSLSGQERV